jgi:hypothetical protein
MKARFLAVDRIDLGGFLELDTDFAPVAASLRNLK